MKTLAEYDGIRIRKCEEEGTMHPYFIERSIGTNDAGVEQWTLLYGPLSGKTWSSLKGAIIKSLELSEMRPGELANLYNELQMIRMKILEELKDRGFDA